MEDNVVALLQGSLGKDYTELTTLQLAVRILLVAAAFLLYLKVSGVQLFKSMDIGALPYLVTVIVGFLCIYAIHADNAFSAYIVAVVIFALLVRLTNETYEI